MITWSKGQALFCRSYDKSNITNHMNAKQHAGFERLNDGHTSLLLPKLIYVALNCLFLGMGIYKCSSLGLLPSTAADYVSRLPSSIANRAEVSGVPLF